MAISTQVKQYASRRLTRRLYRSMPWIGGVVALATIGAAIRRKGFFGGTLDTALDFIPFVGGAKNFAEAARGRDFIRDKPSVGSAFRRTNPAEAGSHK
jgi:putative toxin of predicted polymorphic toxin system